MKYPIFAIIIPMMIAGSSHAVAQSISAPSSDVIMQRLDALDKRNAKLESENAALRDRMRLLEVGKRNPSTASSQNEPAPSPASAMAMVPKSSTSGVYKAPIAYPPAAYNWTGFYVGAHLGGGIEQSQWTDNKPIICPVSPCPANAAGSQNATGPLGGVQAGYNWQFGRWVLGVEGQYSFAKLNADHQNISLQAASLGLLSFTANSVDRLTSKIDGIGTIAGRIGFASDSMDRTLFFLKGGAAFARKQYTDQFNGVGTLCVNGSCGVAIIESGAANGSQNNWGWMAGIGLEYGLTENWSANIEYNYLDFGTKTANLQGTQCQQTFIGVPGGTCAPITRPFDVNQNTQLLKFGVNYRF
jgi:outer membrane immunogenic protein